MSEKLSIIKPSDLGEDDMLILDEKKENHSIEKDDLYYKILEQVYDKIKNDKELFENNKILISKPNINFENKYTYWINYTKNCEQIKRNKEHVKKYIEKELSMNISINGQGYLKIRGRHNIIKISELLKNYIKKFVQCKTCKSLDTGIIKNNQTRIDTLKCLNETCNSYFTIDKI